jgi:hypothetical protein
MQNSAEHGRLSAAANDLLRSPRIRAWKIARGEVAAWQQWRGDQGAQPFFFLYFEYLTFTSLKLGSTWSAAFESIWVMRTSLFSEPCNTPQMPASLDHIRSNCGNIMKYHDICNTQELTLSCEEASLPSWGTSIQRFQGFTGPTGALFAAMALSQHSQNSTWRLENYETENPEGLAQCLSTESPPCPSAVSGLPVRVPWPNHALWDDLRCVGLCLPRKCVTSA